MVFCFLSIQCAGVAQLAEHHFCKVGVVSSILTTGFYD